VSGDSAQPRVLLLGWAGADWRLIQPLLDTGRLPHLDSLIQRGVMGNLFAPAPLTPPILWTDIATGRRADAHGILGFAKPQQNGVGMAPVDAADVQTPSLWEWVRAAGRHARVVGWPVTHPAVCGEDAAGSVTVVSDAFAEARGDSFDAWPLREGTVSDPALEAVLAELRLHPTEVTAEQLLPFVPRLADIDQETDERLPLLVASLARAASVHGAGTWLAEHREWNLLAIHFELIERLSAAFLRYRAPHMPHVSERDFQIYQEVVDGAYQFMDLLLGRYLALVPPTTRVMIVSDHGFHVNQLRPAPLRQGIGDPPARGYRELGIVVCAGSGIKQDELVFGATLLDVAPTVLHLLGLPIPRELEGQALTRMLLEPMAPASSDMLQTAHQPLPAVPDSDWAAGRLRELMTLGYLAPIPADPEEAAEQIQIARLDHLAQVHLSRRRWHDALAVLEELLDLAPERMGTHLAIARCHYALGDLSACRAVVNDLVASGLHGPSLDYLLGQLCLKEGDPAAARTHLERAEAAGVGGWHLLERIGRTHLEAGDPEAAERAFRGTLDIDPEHALALGGLGVSLAKQGRHSEAVECLMRSLGVLQHQPDVHFNLGLSLAALGNPAAALQALGNALAIEPNMPQARAAMQHIQREIAHAMINGVRASQSDRGPPAT
jgi:tetratricopeptide (TPR) repeat protein